MVVVPARTPVRLHSGFTLTAIRAWKKPWNWLLQTEHEEEQLEQAILGVVSSIDKPGSPAGEAKQSFHNSLFGRTHKQRSAFRERILKVSLDDLKRVASTYLTPDSASIAVITSQSNAEQLGDFVKTHGIETQTV